MVLTKSHSTKVLFNWEASQTFPGAQQPPEYLMRGQTAARCQEGGWQPLQPQENYFFCLLTDMVSLSMPCVDFSV